MDKKLVWGLFFVMMIGTAYAADCTHYIGEERIEFPQVSTNLTIIDEMFHKQYLGCMAGFVGGEPSMTALDGKCPSDPLYMDLLVGEYPAGTYKSLIFVFEIEFDRLMSQWTMVRSEIVANGELTFKVCPIPDEPGEAFYEYLEHLACTEFNNCEEPQPVPLITEESMAELMQNYTFNGESAEELIPNMYLIRAYNVAIQIQYGQFCNPDVHSEEYNGYGYGFTEDPSILYHCGSDMRTLLTIRGINGLNMESLFKDIVDKLVVG